MGGGGEKKPRRFRQGFGQPAERDLREKNRKGQGTHSKQFKREPADR